MRQIEMNEVFKNIVITDCLMSIRSVFQLRNKQGDFLNYCLPHQRKFVWPEVKATNFIETIILHGEVPPVVVYIKGATTEEEEERMDVIDGKQRCAAINKFLKDDFRLKPQGLDKLWNLAGKKFSQLDEKLKERIQDTTLRFIIIKAKSEKDMNPYMEGLMKREMFRRYNLGISPLKKEEVFKAQYLQDEINIYFKKWFKQDAQLYDQVVNIFDHKSRNLETMMQHIRQLLVLHNVPINRFVNAREDIINKYYDFLSYKAVNKGDKENIQLIFESFKKKLYFPLEIKTLLDKERIPSNGLIYECIYWALSVCEKEKIKYDEFNAPIFKERMVNHIAKHIKDYANGRNDHAQQIKKRYGLMASFFNSQLDICFASYLQGDEEFLVTHKELMNKYMQDRFMPGLEKEHFSKILPTSNTVEDLLDKMKRGKFNLRPPYQRDEAMSIVKASSLIESILLGIKLYPIYVYLREDGVAEVIDGQQRLLAIIGFLGEKYRNENGVIETSKKDKFSLTLKSGLLPQLDHKKFSELSDVYQRRILNFGISIIEIKENENKHFKPEELFKRLNHKPFPIKENTFEYWNACVDNEVIGSIRELCQMKDWLYLRKEDARMFNEGLVTCLCYLYYMKSTTVPDLDSVKEVLAICSSRFCVSIRIRDKSYITNILQDPACKEEFLLALNGFETDFIEKVELLTSNPTGKTTEFFRNKQLDAMLQTGKVRSAGGFFLLWLVLKGIPMEHIKEARSVVRSKISKVFSTMRTTNSVEKFERTIMEAWNIAVAVDK
ncbi:Protein of unknown function DUF262 [Chitinophaga rupis]|uniref:GmrSD restriction endonucleases N-terminal domain-containing protein n=1 Tax=Chitinophaga rupis TaxID=573321 RepID=A0A1H7M9T2_9BACT|nr:DUF262 domain-containing protein [Chitinophaga rupis]SEL07387.1 Protein of unknown function DUF262 [Chitinophaga rupis]